jgi:hypothetical protein
MAQQTHDSGNYFYKLSKLSDRAVQDLMMMNMKILLTVVAWVQVQVRWHLWWTKWHWGRFSPSTSVSPANSHSTNCSTLIIIIYHLGLVQ